VYVTVRIAGRNDQPVPVTVPALQWTLAGHAAGGTGGSPVPCEQDGPLPNACSPGMPLAAGARCEGRLAFEVPAEVEVRGAVVQARGSATEAASWRLG
jgi:hypothetical protein